MSTCSQHVTDSKVVLLITDQGLNAHYCGSHTPSRKEMSMMADEMCDLGVGQKASPSVVCILAVNCLDGSALVLRIHALLSNPEGWPASALRDSELVLPLQNE